VVELRSGSGGWGEEKGHGQKGAVACWSRVQGASEIGHRPLTTQRDELIVVFVSCHAPAKIMARQFFFFFWLQNSKRALTDRTVKIPHQW
jgi:hypothetical protein